MNPTLRAALRQRARKQRGSAASASSQDRSQALVKDEINAFRKEMNEIKERRKKLESMDADRVLRAAWHTRIQLGSGCIIFYLGILFISVIIGMFVTKLGPFKLKYTIYAKEKAFIRTRTRYPFQIFVHKAVEDKFISVALQRYGQWEIDLHERMMRLMHGYKGATLADLGAHIGFHSLGAVAAGHRAIAVEPIAESIGMLNKSIEANGMEGQIEMLRAAAMDEKKPKLCMHKSRSNKGHSFVRPFSAPHTPTTYRIAFSRLAIRFVMWIFGLHDVVPHWNQRNDHVLDYHKGNHHSDQCDYAEGIVLGELMKERRDIFAVKIDIEGSELRALRGLLPHISDAPPCYIFMEFFPAMLHMQGHTGHDLLDFVTSQSYEVFALGGDLHINQTVLNHFADGGVLKRELEYRGPLHGMFQEEFIGDMTVLELHHSNLDKCLERFVKDHDLPKYDDMGVLTKAEVLHQQDEIPVPVVPRDAYILERDGWG